MIDAAALEAGLEFLLHVVRQRPAPPGDVRNEWRVVLWLNAFRLRTRLEYNDDVPGDLKAQGASFRALGAILANHKLMLALSMSATQMASQFIPFTFIALLLQRNAGADGNEIALIFLLFGGFSVLDQL